jgi:hypothetical protein
MEIILRRRCYSPVFASVKRRSEPSMCRAFSCDIIEPVRASFHLSTQTERNPQGSRCGVQIATSMDNHTIEEIGRPKDFPIYTP